MRHLNRRIFQVKHEKNNENDETSNNVNEKEEERNSTALLGEDFRYKIESNKIDEWDRVKLFLILLKSV